MTDEKWLEKWSAQRERGMARWVISGAATGLGGGILMWLADEAYRWTTGAYIASDRQFTFPYAISSAAFTAVAFRIVWSVCERKYRRLTKATAAPRGIESPTN